MKPLNLKLKNIGAFAGETEIDFSRLNDIFLICGKTGSGKTTILDSICYALYGKLPGARSDHPRMMRSQFVGEDEDSSIVFEFMLGGEKYKIVRVLPLSYVNRNNKVSEKQETVALFKCEQGKYVEIAGKKSGTDDTIKKLIGLSLEEFAKIVVLPQGEFAAFLRLNSNEREKALSKLFPVEDYRSITEFAVNKSKIYRQELSSLEKQIAVLKNDYDEELTGKSIENLTAEENQLNEQHNQLQQELVNESSELQKAVQLKEKITEFNTHKAKLCELEEQKEQTEEKRRKVLKAHIAETVKPYYDNLKLSEQKLEQNRIALSAKNAELADVKNTLEELELQKPQIQTLRELNPRISLGISNLEQARELLLRERELKKSFEHESLQRDEKNGFLLSITEKYKAAADELEKIKQNLSMNDVDALYEADREAERMLEKAKELSKQYKTYSEDVSRLNEVIESVKKHEQKKAEFNRQATMLRQEIETLELQKKHEQQNQAAAVLAKDLRDGEPCPVCGSVHHPNPAFMPDFLTSDEMIASKKQLLERVQEDFTDSEKMISGLNAQKENLEAKLNDVPSFSNFDPVTELANAAAKRQQTKIALDETKRLSNSIGQKERSVLQLKNSIDQLKEELAETAVTLKGYTTEMQTVSERLSVLLKDINVKDTNIEFEIQKLKSEFELNGKSIADFDAKTAETQERYASLNGEVLTMGRQQEILSAEQEKLGKDFEAKLAETDFDSVEQMLECCLEPQAAAALSLEVDSWDSEYERVKTLVLSVPAEVTQTPVPDTSIIEENIKQIRNRQNELNDRLKAVAAEKQSLSDKVSGLAKLEEQRRQLSQESLYYCKLADDLSGKNPLGLRFESWILGVYLEEVAVFASRRLERISDGRYRLLLKTSRGSAHQHYSGLDLEIFDAYTGKKRPCETLSGGETFLASLSLALALTDVVQSKSGGIQLDSLFIDEGFGSLDDGALEKALSVLDEIRGKRMVGLISHVGELQTRIPSGLEVVKSQNGSTVHIKTADKEL